MGDAETEALTASSYGVTFYVLIATVVVVVYFIYNQMRREESWEKYGVKQAVMGPEAFKDFKLGCHNLIHKHGDTVGVSRGGMFLITRDLNILRHVLVKDFNNFVDRMPVLATESAIEKGVFFLKGQDWKRVRHILSPSFSTGKLKGYSKTAEESAKKLGKVLEEFARKDELLPLKHIAGQYTSEITARLTCSLRTDCLGKEDDEFTHYTKSVLKVFGRFMNFIMLVLFRFHAVHLFLVNTLKIRLFDNVNADADNYFQTVFTQAVSERQERARKGEKQEYHDFLQTMIQAKEEADKAVAAAAAAEGHHPGQSADSLPKTMSQRELLGQAILIVFAGFETTASTLQWIMLLLAKHPDIQEKLYEEIENVVSSDTPTYEELSELKYMQQVIDETLRLNPPAPIIHRVAQETISFENITIPKGANVMIALDIIMQDPKHYSDPEKFDPDRFSDEQKAKRDPMSFVPFGYGPRTCLGMRLAYLELKQALVQIIRKVRFELNDRTEPKAGEDVKTHFQGIIVVEKPIHLALKLRKE